MNEKILEFKRTVKGFIRRIMLNIDYFFKKHKKIIICCTILTTVLGLFFLPKIQNSKKYIVNKYIQDGSTEFTETQLNIDCKMMYCTNLKTEECKKNSGYKSCVEKDKQFLNSIKE